MRQGRLQKDPESSGEEDVVDGFSVADVCLCWSMEMGVGLRPPISFRS